MKDKKLFKLLFNHTTLMLLIGVVTFLLFVLAAKELVDYDNNLATFSKIGLVGLGISAGLTAFFGLIIITIQKFLKIKKMSIVQTITLLIKTTGIMLFMALLSTIAYVRTKVEIATALSDYDWVQSLSNLLYIFIGLSIAVLGGSFSISRALGKQEVSKKNIIIISVLWLIFIVFLSFWLPHRYKLNGS